MVVSYDGALFRAQFAYSGSYINCSGGGGGVGEGREGVRGGERRAQSEARAKEAIATHHRIV